MKQIKTRLCNRITDQNLIHLMMLPIEGPERVSVGGGEHMFQGETFFWGGGRGGGGTFVGGGNVHGISHSV